ncbi:hypothetical protein Mapa_011063 [Marchantia paleacea]|nr:hypothetical protein Mapa_011063 [Marchantia paleacea]
MSWSARGLPTLGYTFCIYLFQLKIVLQSVHICAMSANGQSCESSRKTSGKNQYSSYPKTSIHEPGHGQSVDTSVKEKPGAAQALNPESLPLQIQQFELHQGCRSALPFLHQLSYFPCRHKTQTAVNL